MNWDAIFWIASATLGAALIAGGIVAYRGSTGTGARAFGAAATAAGVVMWAVVLLTVPFSSSGGGPPAPTLTGQQLRALLTVEDVRGVLTTEEPLETRFYDLADVARAVDPTQVEDMESFYGLRFQTEGAIKGISFTVVDFNTDANALGHFEKVKSETPGMQDTAQSIGDASADVEVNAQGIGSMLVFIKDDRVVSLHTAQAEGQQPLVPLEGLEELAKIVASRL